MIIFEEIEDLIFMCQGQEMEENEWKKKENNNNNNNDNNNNNNKKSRVWMNNNNEYEFTTDDIDGITFYFSNSNIGMPF